MGVPLRIRHRGAVPAVDRSAFAAPTATLVGDVAPDALAGAVRSVGFARLAFGVDADWEDWVARDERATEVRSAEFAAHADDAVVDADQAPEAPA